MWDVGVDTIQVSGRMFLTTFASKLFRIFIETQEILFISADMFVSFARCRLLRYLNTQRRVKTACNHSFQGFEH